jgi:hypothetical protein
MSASEGTGPEVTQRLLDQSRELLRDLGERLRGGQPDVAATPPAPPGE